MPMAADPTRVGRHFHFRTNRSPPSVTPATAAAMPTTGTATMSAVLA
jgi:hypothetical protein